MRDALIRIAVWASAGFFVSLGWGLYFASATKGIAIGPAVYALARLTQPAAAIILSLRPNFPLGLAWVIAGNAAAYALLGIIVETVRKHRPLHISN